MSELWGSCQTFTARRQAGATVLCKRYTSPWQPTAARDAWKTKLIWLRAIWNSLYAYQKDFLASIPLVPNLDPWPWFLRWNGPRLSWDWPYRFFPWTREVNGPTALDLTSVGSWSIRADWSGGDFDTDHKGLAFALSEVWGWNRLTHFKTWGGAPDASAGTDTRQVITGPKWHRVFVFYGRKTDQYLSGCIWKDIYLTS